jgi:hypothetical protein
MSRDRQIHIKVTTGELTGIANLARKAGKSVSEFLRDLALDSTQCAHCRGSGRSPRGRR